MKALAFLAACASAPLATPRPPTEGVPPYIWIPQWSAPAVLCVHETRLVFDAHGWGCR